MSKKKRKLTTKEKAARKAKSQQYETIFINGKQKRIKKSPTINGVLIDDYIRENADPIFLHQNELWELMEDDN